MGLFLPEKQAANSQERRIGNVFDDIHLFSPSNVVIRQSLSI